MTPDDYCQEKAARSGSSLYYSLLQLPPERRRAALALQAFCRDVAAVVADVSDPSVAHRTLAWWRTQVQAFAQDKAEHPTLRALAPHRAAYNIRPEALLAVIDGRAMDLDQSRYLDFRALERLIVPIAGVPGEIAAGIYGQTDPATSESARQLGAALQLIRIIRDLGQDALQGRIYLPINELQQFEVKAADILQRQYSERFTALMRFQAERAHTRLREALALLPKADRRAQRPALVQAALLHALLVEIERSDFQVMHQRISLTPVRQLWLAWTTWLGQGRLRLPERPA